MKLFTKVLIIILLKILFKNENYDLHVLHFMISIGAVELIYTFPADWSAYFSTFLPGRILLFTGKIVPGAFRLIHLAAY